MNKKRSKKNIIKKLVVILGVIILFFIIYKFIFVVWRPLDTRIVEDRPVYKKICLLQSGCYIAKWDFDCRYLDERLSNDLPINDPNHIDLLHWNKGYHGCNKSTLRYENGKITGIEVCSCKTFG